MINTLAKKLANLEPDKFELNELIEVLFLRLPERSLTINAQLSDLEDRAILVEVLRFWIEKNNWLISHSPIGIKEHALAIETQCPSFKPSPEHINFVEICDSYTQAFIEVYIKAITFFKTREVKNVS